MICFSDRDDGESRLCPLCGTPMVFYRQKNYLGSMCEKCLFERPNYFGIEPTHVLTTSGPEKIRDEEVTK